MTGGEKDGKRNLKAISAIGSLIKIKPTNYLFVQNCSRVKKSLTNAFEDNGGSENYFRDESESQQKFR